MSDTPRTDARVRRLIDNDHSPDQLEHFAKDLERELNAFVRLALGDEAALTLSGNVVLAVATLKRDLEELARLRERVNALEKAGDEMAKWFPFSSTHMKRVVGEWTEVRRAKL